MAADTVLSLLLLLNSVTIAAVAYVLRKAVQQFQMAVAMANSRVACAEARLSRMEWDGSDLGKNIAAVQETGVWPAGPRH